MSPSTSREVMAFGPNVMSLMTALYLMRLPHLQDETVVTLRIGDRKWAPRQSFICYGRGYMGEGMYAVAPAKRWQERYPGIPARPDPSGTPSEPPMWIADPERWPDYYNVERFARGDRGES